MNWQAIDKETGTRDKERKETRTSDKERLAAWMIDHGFATGHGDTLDDLLHELEWQIKELHDQLWFYRKEQDGK